MKNIKKRAVSAITLISLIAAVSSGCQAAKNDGINVTYDGQTIEFDVQPEIIDNRVMVPMRTIFETFGAKVKWDSDSQTITAKRKSKTISMTIGNKDMTKNDETYSFDASPVIKDGRTLVPVRAISDMLGLDVDWDGDNKTVSIMTQSDTEDETWKENTGTIDLSSLTVTGEGVTVSDNVISIEKGGDFKITGSLEDGQIVVDTEEKVKLRLSGMSLTNKSGSAVYIKNADKAYITLTEGTENTLTDGRAYTSGDDKEKGCITACDNLEIKGNGRLIVNGNYNHGIYGGDSVEISNGNITSDAVNDGIHVNETLEISGGILNVTAEGDGIQAEDIIDITGGAVNVTTTGEVSSSENDNRIFGGGMKNMQNMTEEERQSMRGGMLKPEAVQIEETAADESEDITSKGIKAGWLMDISGGEIVVNSTDHAIHCSSDINISGGKMTLTSEKKKGISAHGDVTVDDGDIDIKKSTEGIETKQKMTINGGNINVTASDDGFNAGGIGEMGGGPRMDRAVSGDEKMNPDMMPPKMNDGEMTLPDMPQRGEADNKMPPQISEGNMPNGIRGGMGGSNTSEISAQHHIQINGGTIYINAQGDGIDSNGSLVIDGGIITVDGPVSGGDSAFDTDGAFMINGGTVTGVSAVGMVEIPNSYSKQNIISYTMSESTDAGKQIEVKNSSGKTVTSFTPAKACQSYIFSSPDLETGETYKIYVDGEEKDSLTISDIITSVGTEVRSNMGGHGMNKGMRGQKTEILP